MIIAVFVQELKPTIGNPLNDTLKSSNNSQILQLNVLNNNGENSNTLESSSNSNFHDKNVY